MRSKNKQVAEKIVAILQSGLTLNAATQHYIDSTFSNPSVDEFEALLQDESGCRDVAAARHTLEVAALFQCRQTQRNRRRRLPAITEARTSSGTFSGRGAIAARISAGVSRGPVSCGASSSPGSSASRRTRASSR